MDVIPVTVVVGAGSAARADLAERLVADGARRRVVVPVTSSVPGALLDVERSVREASTGLSRGLVLDVPLTVPIAHLLSVLRRLRLDRERVLQLDGILAVVDLDSIEAALRSGAAVRLTGIGTTIDRDDAMPVAHLLVHQLECATVLHLWRSGGLADRGDEVGLDLVQALNPLAEVVGPPSSSCRPAAMPTARAGEESSPAAVVERFDYVRARPFHPGRLEAALSRAFDPSPSRLIRSSGVATVASRSGGLLWDQLGATINLHPLIAHPSRLPPLGQQLTVVSRGAVPAELSAALDDALLTDAEFLAAPSTWRSIEDPFSLNRIIA